MIRESKPLIGRFLATRRHSEQLCAPLALEDHVCQPVAEVSPPKWHLGHTAWFFETVILKAFVPGYRVFDPGYAFVFNSYYESQGERVFRGERGALSRPTVAETLAYRAHVDRAMLALLGEGISAEVEALVEQGLQHEQQHQELLLTDIKYILGQNPLLPPYSTSAVDAVDLDAEHTAAGSGASGWLECAGGVAEIGHRGDGFAFDNERARHPVLLRPMQIRAGLVSNAEYLEFMADGGYGEHRLWHADGWDWVQAQSRKAPLHWLEDPEQPGQWRHYTLRGPMPLRGDAPVTHVNFFEAHAFCAWAGWRLPSEFEWEALAPQLHWGQRWEWTGSAYLPYPGFKATDGAAGEYNGKFMVNQMVLRGASYATPAGHARLTYRNFFYAPQRWQYTGIRPARD